MAISQLQFQFLLLQFRQQLQLHKPYGLVQTTRLRLNGTSLTIEVTA